MSTPAAHFPEKPLDTKTRRHQDTKLSGAGHLALSAAVVLLSLLALVVACGGRVSTPESSASAAPDGRAKAPAPVEATVPTLNLALTDKSVSLDPLPLRAGYPFTVTAVIQNKGQTPATDIPVMVYISAQQPEIDYTSFSRVLTVTVPAGKAVPVTIPVRWNFAGGQHQLWVQVNRLPKAWESKAVVQPEADVSDNSALLDLDLAPFDSYVSDLCPGRVDVAIGPGDVGLKLDLARVLVRVHNVGNQAVYDLPVVVTGDRLTGVAYTPAIPPCGGTAEVAVEVDRAFAQGENLTVQVNPEGWPNVLPEVDFGNNVATATAGAAPGTPGPPAGGEEDYDFWVSSADITAPEAGLLMITVHNLGTRDAASVPVLIQNQAGRRVSDSIPLVQGSGVGVAAIQLGSLWSKGSKLTLTVNPASAQGSYPESNRANNTATFTVP